jgi:hypothetical protein
VTIGGIGAAPVRATQVEKAITGQIASAELFRVDGLCDQGQTAQRFSFAFCKPLRFEIIDRVTFCP